jgi:chromosome segregation ATPase
LLLLILIDAAQAAPKETASTNIGIVIAILGALLGGSGIVGWLTVRNTNKSIAVTASNDAVEAVDKALERIEKELERSHRQVEHLQQRLDQARSNSAQERQELREELRQTKVMHTAERHDLEQKIKHLQERIGYLESQLQTYRRRDEDQGRLPRPYDGPERRHETTIDGEHEDA